MDVLILLMIMLCLWLIDPKWEYALEAIGIVMVAIILWIVVVAVLAFN